MAATAAIGVALSQGALAASFSVSGQQFKVTTDRLDGTGFVQYGAIDAQKGGKAVPVAVSAFSNAKIKNLCQSVVVPVPVFGDVSLKLSAGGGSTPVEAKNLYIDLDQLDADATFNNINIGVAAGSTSKGPGIQKGDKTDPGSFAQEADSAVLTHVKQTAWATTAGTFKLSGLKMSVAKGKNECY
ncbi:cholesterol esterase [Streptomyces nigrescens]|uniref:Cholesterol esterase n=1 Tax=Streptomyces nigrescens TaxID=1920 RepID=A0ABM8A0M8_STRNI|nr:cholesterol esterase [Streptomyces nigrescens]